MPVTTPAVTPQRAFEILCQVITKAEQKKPGSRAEIQRRIAAHIRAVSGIAGAGLPTYHNARSIGDEEKLALYNLCRNAIITGDYSTLKGDVGVGDKRVDPMDIPVPETEKATEATTLQPPVTTTSNEETVTTPPRRVNTPVPEGTDEDGKVMDELTRVLVKRFKGLLPQQERAPLDEGRVREIAQSVVDRSIVTDDQIKEVVKGCLTNGEFPEERVKRIAEEVMASRGVTRIVVETPQGNAIDVGRQHYKFPLLLKIIGCRLPFVLTGPAGSFKTSATEAGFKACGMDFAAMSVGPMTSKSDIFGFTDANGVYRITSTVRRAIEGGGMLWDEIDAANAGVLTSGNMLLSNEHVALSDNMKPKHKDFCLGATANTFMLGADRQYIGRNQLDAATIDRFVFLEWDYDEGMEAALVGLHRPSPRLDIEEGGVPTVEEWYDRVLKVRAACKDLSVRHVVSPRATIYGAKLLSVGVGMKHLNEMVIWKGLDRPQREKIVQHIGS